jgi:homoserine kinase
MMKAIELVNLCKGVTSIQYNGETLYNVLMEKHDNMMINNLICETLHPENIMAKICGGKYNSSEKNRICAVLTEIIKKNNFKAYKQLYASLK